MTKVSKLQLTVEFESLKLEREKHRMLADKMTLFFLATILLAVAGIPQRTPQFIFTALIILSVTAFVISIVAYGLTIQKEESVISSMRIALKR